MSIAYAPRTDGLGMYGRPQGDPNYGQPLSGADQAREMYERAIRAENRAKGQGDPNFAYEVTPPPPINGPIYDGGPFDPNTGPRQDLPSPGSPPPQQQPIPVDRAKGTAAPTGQGTRKKKAPKGGRKNIQPRNQVQSAILGGASRAGR